MIKLISSEPDLLSDLIHDMGKVSNTNAEGALYLILPETALHPATQHERILYYLQYNLGLVILTYSEHVLNAVRIAVIRGLVKADDVVIEYHTAEGKLHPRIYSDGGIDNWPAGFFDQTEIQLGMILDERRRLTKEKETQ